MFEIKTVTGKGPHYFDQDIPFIARIRYRTGENYSDGNVTWNLSSQPSQFQPEGWIHFLFGSDLSSQQFPWETERDVIPDSASELPPPEPSIHAPSILLSPSVGGSCSASPFPSKCMIKRSENTQSHLAFISRTDLQGLSATKLRFSGGK